MYLSIQNRQSSICIPCTTWKFTRSPVQNKIPLTKQKLILMLRSTLQQAGINTTCYSGHPFRIGAATTAAPCGIPDVAAVVCTSQCRSSAYQTCIEVSTRDLAAICQKIASYLLRGSTFSKIISNCNMTHCKIKYADWLVDFVET